MFIALGKGQPFANAVFVFYEKIIKGYAQCNAHRPTVVGEGLVSSRVLHNDIFAKNAVFCAGGKTPPYRGCGNFDICALTQWDSSQGYA